MIDVSSKSLAARRAAPSEALLAASTRRSSCLIVVAVVVSLSLLVVVISVRPRVKPKRSRGQLANKLPAQTSGNVTTLPSLTINSFFFWSQNFFKITHIYRTVPYRLYRQTTKINLFTIEKIKILLKKYVLPQTKIKFENFLISQKTKKP